MVENSMGWNALSHEHEEENLRLEWCMKACRLCALNSSTYWQDEINIIWPHGEYEVVGNYGYYDKGNVKDLEKAICEERLKKSL